MTKKRASERLQELALYLRRFPPFHALFAAIYSFATWFFVRQLRRMNQRLARPAVCAIYVRRGQGRAEALPGASDLDFFLVLEEIGSQEEMVFLKAFWNRFRSWKKVFPFLGETLMADRNEFRNWFTTPTVRTFESSFSWKLLWGEAILSDLGNPSPPALRDVFSEAAKSYWMILKPLLREERLEFAGHSREAVEFRHSAKAALDFFRLHYSFGGQERLSDAELARIWSASREKLPELLPKEYGDLRRLLPLLLLKDPLPNGEALFQLMGEMSFLACGFLAQISAQLAEQDSRRSFRRFEPLVSKDRLGKDKYSFAVRELFAERMILRHRPAITRVLVADETTHIFFPFAQMPGRESYLALLRDLREAGTSFNRSSVAIPLTEQTLAELERTSFLDSPFHAFLSQQELKLSEEGHVESSPYECRGHEMPIEVLQKTFAEVSLALRFQPPPDFFYVVEHLITLVLQLRVAEEDGKVPVSFYAALKNFSDRHPLRGDYIKEQLGKYLNLCHEDEDRLWGEVFSAVDRLGATHPNRATLLRAQLAPIRDSRFDAEWKLEKATTDLWIQMTPFLRLEMNAMRERYLSEPAPLRV